MRPEAMDVGPVRSVRRGKWMGIGIGKEGGGLPLEIRVEGF
jgi:hypothetical protein